MTEPTFDTSGVVNIPNADPYKPAFTVYTWSSLNPFCQGYVEALLRDVEWPDPAEGYGPSCAPKFGWLAPAALSQILEDCERYCAESAVPLTDFREGGASYWSERQGGHISDIPTAHPPLRAYLVDDGLIYLREVA